MKKILILLAIVFTANTAVAQTQVGAVTLPNSVNFGGEDLALNGAGIRKKAFVLKLYSGGLYLQDKSSNAKSIINADETMAIKLHITSSFVSSEAMSDAVREGFDASLDGNTSSLSSEIEKFIGFFSDEIVENNVFDITYQKGKGVVAYKNGKELGTISGMAFKKALFGIWLGDDPADSKLKKAMLGK
ncbi:chalcone isomerase family protein [Marinirhabdus gelatinilytica]|uniref:Chalcone isomerase-like protein n=1 Tax=Marinirhabdus gelatinilytica TaxID=1703343 RepID=A0A370QFR5_9FLAO|nr:chalcone isomerase family protein [Marinirhabdus gelatinilytica]RDK87207.1 chalcone isomerase-like protein [Marinirhabdus gelatinilytica]